MTETSAPAPEPLEADLPTEQEYAAWLAWLKTEGYDFADDSYQAEAFAAGMRAQGEIPASSASVKDESVLTCLADTLARLTTVEVLPEGCDLTIANRGIGKLSNPAEVARVLFDALREELSGS